jgi:osmoprotectant transport system substrate-binding protein
MGRGMGPMLAGIALTALCWSGGAAAQTIVVGGKAFTEQQIMTAMTVALLKAKGFTPERKAGMGSAAVRSALENGQVDVYWEYTGTGLGVFNKITDKFNSAEEAYRKIKEVDGAKGIVWLNMSAVNNTYGFAMNRDEAQKRGIASVSDLAKAINGGAKLTSPPTRSSTRAPTGFRDGRKRTDSSSTATTSSVWIPG